MTRKSENIAENELKNNIKVGGKNTLDKNNSP
jgi:hypothetical protein